MIVRELITRLGWSVDTAGYQRAEAQYARARKSAVGASGANAAAGASFTAAGARARTAAPKFAAAGAAVQSAGSRARGASGKFIGAGNAADRAGRKFLGLQQKSVGLKDALGAVGGVLAGSLIARGLGSIVEAASSANEDTNVLESVFGAEGRANVDEWAKTVGTAMGRSRYAMRNSAAGLGAILEKMTDTPEAALAMSKSLAGLSVDLGSFYNTTDDIALTALKSGITGELEPLKKFGIVMTEAALAEFAHEQGIRKKVKAMNNREKTALRYQFILANTVKAQGDAAKTADGYANATKGLRAAMTDVGVAIGMAALPKVERLVQWVRDGARAFADWTKDTNVLGSALTVLGTMGAAAAIRMLAPYAKLIGKFGLWGIAIATATLLLDELHTAYDGGVTVIGKYIDKAFGIGTLDEIVNNHRDGVAQLGDEWELAKKRIGEFAAAIPVAFDDVASYLSGWVDQINGIWGGLPDWLRKPLEIAFKTSNIGRTISQTKVLGEALADVDMGALARSEGLARANAALNAAGPGWLPRNALDNIGNMLSYSTDDLDAATAAKRGPVRFGVANVGHRDTTESSTATAPRASARRTTPAPAANYTTVEGSTVNINGPVSRGDAAHLRRELAAQADRDRRRTAAALERPGGG